MKQVAHRSDDRKRPAWLFALKACNAALVVSQTFVGLFVLIRVCLLRSVFVTCGRTAPSFILNPSEAQC
jgi:hypothetical protein